MTTTTMVPTIVTHKPLFTFLGLVTVLAALSYAIAFSGGEGNVQGGIVLVQLAPILSAIIAKLIYQRNLRGLGWGWGKTRYQLASYALPALLGLISFGLVWLLGFGGFYNEVFLAEAQVNIADSFGLTIAAPAMVMLALILLNGTIGLIPATIFAIGEEVGWRGFLVPELYKQVNFTKTSLISGVIFAVYHFPLLIFLYAPSRNISPWPLLVFTIIAGIGISTIMAWLRIKSGSVWAAIIFHGSLNTFNQTIFQNLTTETSRLTHYISGEHGLMLALVMAVAAYFFWRKRDSLPAPQR